MPERVRAAVYVMAFCGLRFYELRGLRRWDVDVEAGVLHVRRQIQEVRGKGKVTREGKSTGSRTATTPSATAPLPFCIASPPRAGTSPAPLHSQRRVRRRPARTLSQQSPRRTPRVPRWDKSPSDTTLQEHDRRSHPGAAAQTLTWDAEGELSGVTSDENKNGTVEASEQDEYVYTADGERLVRKQDGGITVYLPGQELHVALNGAVSAKRYYGFAGTTVAVGTANGFGSVWSVLSDHHGTGTIQIANRRLVCTSQSTRPMAIAAASAKTSAGHEIRSHHSPAVLEVGASQANKLT